MTNATATDFVIDAAPVIPVVVIEDASKAADLAKALVDALKRAKEVMLGDPSIPPGQGPTLDWCSVCTVGRIDCGRVARHAT